MLSKFSKSWTLINMEDSSLPFRRINPQSFGKDKRRKNKEKALSSLRLATCTQRAQLGKFTFFFSELQVNVWNGENAIRWSKNDLGVFPPREEEKPRIFLEIERFLYGTHVWCNNFFFIVSHGVARNVYLFYTIFSFYPSCEGTDLLLFQLRSLNSLVNHLWQTRFFLGENIFP